MLQPTLHILGLGSGRLDKLPLKIYRVLTAAQAVYVWSARHPAAVDMIEEGLPCIELYPEAGIENPDQDWESVVNQIAERVAREQTENRQVVLALPDNPLREAKIVRSLESVFAKKFKVNTELLAENDSLARLKAIMAELRSTWGCPWDREQTHTTLKKYLIEEAYEVLEAIDTNNMNNLCEELGDLLLQVVFHAQLAEEAQQFSLSDVQQGISEKLIRRHPHVFGSVIAKSSEEVLTNWDAIKKSEKTAGGKKEIKPGDFFNIPLGLPALQRAEKVQRKAAKVGFDWNGYEGPLAKIYEELTELKQEIGEDHNAQEELGDLLFSIVNLARFLGVDAEESLRQGTKKFQERFVKMQAKIQGDGQEIDKLSLKELDLYWDSVKNDEKYGTLGSF